MFINLIRHGKTKANELNLISGTTERDLSENGKKEILNYKRLNYYSNSVQCCFSSKQSRAIQTAKLIYPNLPLIIDENFNEINFGDYEDSNYEMFKDNPEYIRWIKQDNRMLITAPNGEPIREARIRLEEGLKKAIKYSRENKLKEIAIIGHGNLLSEFSYMYLNDERLLKTRMEDYFPNALGIVVNINDEDKNMNFSFIKKIGGN